MSVKTRWTLPVLAAFLFMGLVYSMFVDASVFKAAGAIESTSGGFVFPDGSVQTTAALDSCTPITYSPFVISDEGVYCLMGNLEWSSTTGTPISIEADNVLIDLGGWIIDGISAGPSTNAIGIYASRRKNITIRNGTIRGFYRGIFLRDSNPYGDSTGHLIENIRAVNNTQSGFRTEGIGIIVRHNHIVGTGGSTNSPDVYALGIQMYGVGCRLLDNDVVDTFATGTARGAGLWLNACSDTVISNNRIDNVSTEAGEAYGIYGGHSTENLIIEANSIISADRGIYTGSSGKFRNNLTSNVNTPFVGGATDAGGNN